MTNILDDPIYIKRFDNSGMIDVLCKFPLQCRDAQRIGVNIKLSVDRKMAQRSRYLLFCGVGASALSGELAAQYLRDEIQIPVIVNRDCSLPLYVDNKGLLFLSSYSGNSQEAVNIYSSAKKRKIRPIVLSSNGKLEDMAIKDNIDHILMPKGYQPRCAIGYSFLLTIRILNKLGLTGNKTRDIEESIEVLSGLRDKVIGPGVPAKRNISKTIAEKAHNRIPVIYGAGETAGAVISRWKTEFNENSKNISFSREFPEMSHNEIQGWLNPAEDINKFVVIFLRTRGDNRQMAKRMDLAASILKKRGMDIINVESPGAGRLSRILSLIYIGDFASFYLGMLNRTDPSPIEDINYIKQSLKKG